MFVLNGSAWGRFHRVEPRFLIVLACFLATFTAYVERVGFSIAFTAISKEAGLDETTKGTILSAFYWGYGVSQVPGGYAAQRYGGRIMLLLSFACWSMVSCLTPTDAARTSGIITARVAVGLAQGVFIPSIHTVLSQWIPPHERARAVSLTTSGMYLGSAGAMLLLPSLAAALGPRMLLKLLGGCGAAWLLLWMAVGRETPHRESMIPLSSLDKAAPQHNKGRPAATPLRGMVRSPAVWAIVLNNFSFHYAFYVVMNWLPTYFNSVLKAELASVGSLKTLPYLVMFATSNLGGWVGDYLILQRLYPVARARKAVNTVGFVSSAAALMLMPAAGSTGAGILATSLTLGCLGFARGGFSVNHMDIAPKYAGVIMGISNTAGTLSGVIGVAVTGYILESAGGASNIGGWQQALSLCALICALASIVFAMFARGERTFD